VANKWREARFMVFIIKPGLMPSIEGILQGMLTPPKTFLLVVLG
jgi:hypothetical protein